jgi:hypothetical protein
LETQLSASGLAGTPRLGQENGKRLLTFFRDQGDKRASSKKRMLDAQLFCGFGIGFLDGASIIRRNAGIGRTAKEIGAVRRKLAKPLQLPLPSSPFHCVEDGSFQAVGLQSVPRDAIGCPCAHCVDSREWIAPVVKDDDRRGAMEPFRLCHEI